MIDIPHRFKIWLLASALVACGGCGDDLRNPGDVPALPRNPEIGARAHWLTQDTIAWPAGTAGQSFELAFADSGMAIEGAEVARADGALALTAEPELSAELKAKFPHLAGHRGLRIADTASVPDILRQQFLVVERDANDFVIAASRVQIPGVLDELYKYDGELGVTVSQNKAAFRLWAPTARSVELHVYDRDSKTEMAAVDMTEQDGVWSATEPATENWYGHYYRYEVDVYVPSEGDYVANLVTDPYSLGLSTNSEYSLIVDLNDAATKPADWDTLGKPALEAFEDIAIYELHIRDFSIGDATVTAEHDRGKYTAFTYNGTGGKALSNGMNHLKQLATAGLTHIHLLPAFDIATIDEDSSARVELDGKFDALCAANSEVPADLCRTHAGKTIREVFESLDPLREDVQAINAYLHELDGFNWGYDPFHYTAPEGSYATDPEGMTRIREFRAMVKGLSQIGLRVAMDVVYNHTNASGQNAKSVLDRIVPGYYHRLDADTGDVERSTCCENTATENAMMEKLMVDSVVTWAKHYKVDSFRFDLMGHHMKVNMLAVKTALEALTLADDGVDGSKIFIYGEGWNFGEVGNNARGKNATQINLSGTGIATFSDRLRDGVRGGGPFDGGDDLRKRQGFATGLCYDNNEMNSTPASEDECKSLLEQTDWVRIGMAGNLADFVFVAKEGVAIKGSSASYYGQAAGYTEDPQEVITYISAHDNQTLWDNNQYKLVKGTSMDDRVRVQNLGMSVVVLSQGVPFMHAGTDMLRSKSMERDSFNSGDWFNALDFTYESNNWNVGLPRKDKDGGSYGVIAKILGDFAINPQKAHIEAAVEHFREVLKIRKSSVLFRLRKKSQVTGRVDFHNTGANQKPGLIVMSITDGTCAGADLDTQYDAIVVLVNANDEEQTFKLAGADGFELHPIQQSSNDDVVKTSSFDDTGDEFTIPARTAAVFVQPQQQQPVTQGAGLPCNDRVPVGLRADVYVRGTFTSNFDVQERARLIPDSQNDDILRVTLMIEANSTHRFKVADATWGIHNWGINNTTIIPDGTAHVLKSEGDITLDIATTGMYTFTLDVTDFDNPTIEVEPAT